MVSIACFETASQGQFKVNLTFIVPALNQHLRDGQCSAGSGNTNQNSSVTARAVSGYLRGAGIVGFYLFKTGKIILASRSIPVLFLQVMCPKYMDLATGSYLQVLGGSLEQTEWTVVKRNFSWTPMTNTSRQVSHV